MSIAAAVAIALTAAFATGSPARAQSEPVPSIPQIELLTENPHAGDEVRLRFTSSDPESGIAAFHYGINVEGAQHTVESDGEAEISFTAGLGRTFVYVWAENHAGNQSARATLSFFAGRFIAPAPKGAWRLDGNGADDSGQSGGLDIPSDVDWEHTTAPAPFGQALRLTGGDCYGAAVGTAVRTDAAFWVSAWVRLDSVSTDQVFVSKAGTNRSGFALGYDAESDRLTVTLTDRDVAEGSISETLASTSAPQVGSWTHLSATVAPGSRTIRLYVDGVLDNEAGYSFSSRNFTAPFHIGCDAPRGTAHLDGAMTHVGAWQGLPNQAFLDAAYRGDLVPGAAAEWRLRGDGSDASAQDHALDLPDSLTWGEDQYGRAESAAYLDGSTCASVGDSVLGSQADLSVEAWVKLDRTDQDQTVLAQAAKHRHSFSLGYDAAEAAWLLALPSGNGRNPAWATVTSSTSPEAGQWTHLVATVATDRASDAGTLSLYVDGALEATTELGFTPIEAKKLVTLGCASDSDGDTDRFLEGALSDVRLWRGALDAAAVTEAHVGNPEAQLAAGWDFFFGDIDGFNDVELEVHGTEGVDYRWEDVFEGSVWTGLGLDGTGTGYASTVGPVATTDESFTVMAAASLAAKDVDQTVLAQSGQDTAGFELGYDAVLDRFHFTIPSAEGTEARVVGSTSPVEGRWYTIAAVYDLPGDEIRLYVDGLLVGTADGPEHPWRAEGPLTVGLAGNTAGDHWSPLNGIVANPIVWSSVLSDERIRIRGGNF